MSGEPVHPGSEAIADRAALLREPALPILLLALVALVKRGYLLDILLVVAACAVVLVDAGRWHGRIASAAPGPEQAGTAEAERRRWWVATGVLALLMAPMPRHSRWLDLAFAVVGLVVLALVWLPGRDPGPGTGREPGRPPRWRWWPSVGVAVCLVELSTLAYQPSPRVDSADHPSISTVLEPALQSWPARAVGLWLWLLGGWWLVRRVRAWAA